MAATHKADGIRALKLNDKLVSRTLKPIRNKIIASMLEQYLPNGADGEIICGDTFQETTSIVMTVMEPTSNNNTSSLGCQTVKFYWFDHVDTTMGLTEPYMERTKRISDWVANNQSPTGLEIIPLVPTIISTTEELQKFESDSLSKGFEGVMIRTPTSPYKCGRSTLKQAYLLKVKRFMDSEATVLDMFPLMHNHNTAEIDERGYTKRSSHKENLEEANTLGAMLVRDVTSGLEFNIGTGFNATQRDEFWANKTNLVGKLVKYKYFPVGVKEAPRHPVFLGFRDQYDM
jgi:DNA ligase-1